MAKYEAFGACPYNSFFRDDLRPPTSPHWPRCDELLRGITTLMFYPLEQQPECWIVDAIKCATGTLGIEITSVLKAFIGGNLEHAKVRCFDARTINEIPANVYAEYHTSGNPPTHAATPNTTVCEFFITEDERYVAYVQKHLSTTHSETLIDVYLYKKPPLE